MTGRLRIPTARELRRALRRLRRPPVVKPLTGADVTIVVLNWNRREDTLECLASLQAADLGGASLLVVDNGSSDGTAAAVRERFPGVEVLELPENRGYAGGNNAGIRHALDRGAGAVCLLNNDTYVAQDFLPPLLEVLNDHPWICGVSGAILRADSPTCLDAAYLEIYFGHGVIRQRGVNALPGEGFDQVCLIDAGIGCCFLIRAEAFRAIGLLDEEFFAYHEEVDWCYRAKRAGWDVAYQPYSRVWHHGSRSTQALGRERRGRRGRSRGDQLPNSVPLPWNPVRSYLGARNAVRFVRKHSGPVRLAKFAGSFAHAIPLELLAVLLDREEEAKMGQWSYRKAVQVWLATARDEAAAKAAARTGDAAAAPGRLAVALEALRFFPAEFRAARADGATAQLECTLRGTWDGIRGRPLPLHELGLR